MYDRGAHSTISCLCFVQYDLRGLQLLAGYSTVIPVRLPRSALFRWMCNIRVSCYKAGLMLHAPITASLKMFVCPAYGRIS